MVIERPGDLVFSYTRLATGPTASLKLPPGWAGNSCSLATPTSRAKLGDQAPLKSPQAPSLIFLLNFS